MTFLQKAMPVVCEFLRRAGLFALFCTAPYFWEDCAKTIYHEGTRGIVWVCLCVVSYLGSWIVSRPRYTTVSVALFWTFLFCWGEYVASSSRFREDFDMADLPLGEAAFYAPFYHVSFFVALALGIFTVIVGRVYSRKVRQAVIGGTA